MSLKILHSIRTFFRLFEPDLQRVRLEQSGRDRQARRLQTDEVNRERVNEYITDFKNNASPWDPKYLSLNNVSDRLDESYVDLSLPGPRLGVDVDLLPPCFLREKVNCILIMSKNNSKQGVESLSFIGKGNISLHHTNDHGA